LLVVVFDASRICRGGSYFGASRRNSRPHSSVSTPNVTHPTRGKWVSADRKERFVASQRHVTGGEAISPLSVIGGCALIYDGGDLNLAH
jgi:hypothetical protein